ncbi:phage portal protein [Alloalcanivorax xenomutans]|uniref:phage portal protein n=1 Tax=Alloalcanivorax xenomutans TaxID=1094342 RepID=UPI003BACD6FC
MNTDEQDKSVKAASPEAFTFGEPEGVLDGNAMMDYYECWANGKWYEPPVSFEGLAKFFRANQHHSSAIYVKRNILVSGFKPHKLLSRTEFSKWVLDFLTYGNGYVEEVPNMLGQRLPFKRAMALHMRRGVQPDKYYMLHGIRQEHEFEEGAIFHLEEPDVKQEVYGLPEYLASIHSGLLNESATIFRRRYYKNGSHAGFILYMSDAAQTEDDVDALRQALKDSKGPGNFRNLFMYSPNGKKDGLQVIPISEVTAKDEFFNIKNITRDDVLAAHRVPPSMMGIIPQNTAGFGDVEKAAKVFMVNELEPLQRRFQELNEWAGIDLVQFDPYALEESVSRAASM